MIVYEEECEAAGLDPKEVARIARGIERYVKQAKKLGLTVFGGGTSGSLRFTDERAMKWGNVIVVYFTEGYWNGGDGGLSSAKGEGLRRGEV